MLLAVFGGQLLPSTADADYNLAEFNNSGFGWLWGDFSETIGTSEVRLRDSSDGWGGAGFDVNAVDFSSYADEYLVIDFTPEAANGVDYFDIEFIEGTSGSSTTKSGKWRFDLSGTTPGVATTLTSTTTLSSPADGVGDYQNLDLSQIQKWQVLGEYGSSETFDMRFDNIALTGTAPPAYPGAEPDAAWRAEAASRIEANRKANLTVTVVDSAGNAVPDASVSVAMQRHEFGFGSAVQAYRVRDNNPAYDTYKQKTSELFNLATLENNLKWPPWEGEWGTNWTQQGAQDAVAWLAGEGIDVRGHTLVWPGYNELPQSVKTILDGAPLNATEQPNNCATRSRVTSRMSRAPSPGSSVFGTLSTRSGPTTT